MEFLSSLLGICVVGVFLLLLYLNNGSTTIKYYQFPVVTAFECSTQDQLERYYFIPNKTGLDSQIGYVINRTKDSKSIEVGGYHTQITLGRKLGYGFWQMPEPYFITPIFSTRYYDEGKQPIKLEFELFNKIGYGITESSFPAIGKSGYDRGVISDIDLSIGKKECTRISPNFNELNLIKSKLGQ